MWTRKKNLIVVSGIKQILFDKMQAKQAVQQTNDDPNGTRAVNKDNVVADILRAVGLHSEIRIFLFTRISKSDKQFKRQTRRTSCLMKVF